MRYLPCLLWIPLLAIKLALVILGLVVVPIALLMKADMKTLPIWGNREGVLSFCKGTDFWSYAITNPVNNLRYLFDEPIYQEESNWHPELQMEAPEMIVAGRAMAYRYRWSGWMSGYRRVWLNSNDRYSEFWIGWKLGSGVPGLGFTSQLRLKRKVGT
jgi:hypothetical protein